VLTTRLLDEQYLQGLLAIERQVHTSPWSRAKFESCFASSLYQVIGVFKDARLCAYAVLQVIPPDAELQNLAVTGSCQCQGMGKELLQFLIRHCRNMACETLLLEVRESNAAAIRLYTRAGFKRVGLRKNYYQSGVQREHALLFTKVL